MEFTKEQLATIINVFYSLKWDGKEWDTVIKPLLEVAQSQLPIEEAEK